MLFFRTTNFLKLPLEIIAGLSVLYLVLRLIQKIWQKIAFRYINRAEPAPGD